MKLVKASWLRSSQCLAEMGLLNFGEKLVDASGRRKVSKSAGTRTGGDRSMQLGVVESCELHSHHQDGEVQAGMALKQGSGERLI